MKKIIFRADAGMNIGYGHFTRTLALADMLKDDFDCYFATVNPTSFQIEEIKKVCELIELPGNDLHFNFFISLLTGEEIVVLDNYFFNEAYQLLIKSKGCKLVCIDDLHDRHFYADIVINQALGIDSSQYSSEAYTKYLLGFKYILLRNEFMIKNKEIKEKIYSCFIMIGGADPFNITEKIADIIEKYAFLDKIAIVLNESHNSFKRLQTNSKISLFSDINAAQIYHLMQVSKFGIIPASTVSLECCAARLPIICGYYVENQKEIYSGIKKNNLAICVGNFNEITTERLSEAIKKIESPMTISTIISNQLKKLDKKSSNRYLKIFHKL